MVSTLHGHLSMMKYDYLESVCLQPFDETHYIVKWFVRKYTRLEKETELSKDMFLPELCLPRVCNSSETKHYVNVSVLIKFSQKTSVYLNYHKFSIKSYVLDVY